MCEFSLECVFFCFGIVLYDKFSPLGTILLVFCNNGYFTDFASVFNLIELYNVRSLFCCLFVKSEESFEYWV